MAIKKTIVVNSVDRNFGTSSNFQVTYKRKNAYICRSFYISSVVMKSSYYVVNTSNNGLLFTHPGVGSGSTTITVTPGNYSTSTLITFIQAKLDLIAAGWTIAITPATNKFTISTAGNSFGFDASQSDSILSKLMGYEKKVYSSDTNAKASTNVADLGGPNYLYIKSNALSFKENEEPISTNTSDTGILVSIPVDVNSFDTIIYRNFDDGNSRPFDKAFPNVIDIRITDINNIDIDLNGTEWSMELIAYFDQIFN